jgi:hypothetical protein
VGSGCILTHTPQLQPSQVVADVQGVEQDTLVVDVLARMEKGLLPRTSWLVWMADSAQATRLCVSCEGFSGSGGSLWSRWNQTTLMWKAGQAVSPALLNEARQRGPPPALHSRQTSPPSGSAAPAASDGGASPASPLRTLPPLNLEGQSVIPVPSLGFIVLPPQGRRGPSQPTGRLLIRSDALPRGFSFPPHLCGLGGLLMGSSSWSVDDPFSAPEFASQLGDGTSSHPWSEAPKVGA